MCCAGFVLWSLRGMWLRPSWISASCTGLWLTLVPLGSHRRSSPLVCSLLGHCHGHLGSQKNTSMPHPCSTSAQRAISEPWSQVRVLEPARKRRDPHPVSLSPLISSRRV